MGFSEFSEAAESSFSPSAGFPPARAGDAPPLAAPATRKHVYEAESIARRAEFGAELNYEATRKRIARAYGKQIKTVGEGKAGRKLNPDTVDAFIGEKIRAEKSNRRR